MNLILKRVKALGYTEGKLFIDGKYFCDTLENPCRNLVDINGDGDLIDPGEGKIPGETAIPAGTYEILMTFWPAKNAFYPLLLNVLGFSGIFIHEGNTVADTKGCPLVGVKCADGLIGKSRDTCRKLRAILSNATSAISITIEE